PTQGKAHDMNRLQAERSAKSNALRRHLHDRVRRFSSRSRNAGIVKQNDLMIRCEAVRDHRVPAIHIGVEVLQEKQRNRSWFAETTVGITDPFGFHKLYRRCLMRIVGHICTPNLLVYGAKVNPTTSRFHRNDGRNFYSPVLVSLGGKTL